MDWSKAGVSVLRRSTCLFLFCAASACAAGRGCARTAFSDAEVQRALNQVDCPEGQLFCESGVVWRVNVPHVAQGQCPKVAVAHCEAGCVLEPERELGVVVGGVAYDVPPENLCAASIKRARLAPAAMEIPAPTRCAEHELQIVCVNRQIVLCNVHGASALARACIKNCTAGDGAIDPAREATTTDEQAAEVLCER
jgi:hypothetical protein